MSYPILNTIHSPADVRELLPDELEQLCEELRIYMQMETGAKAGHVQASLGVVELTVALHFHFDTPDDILIWDVGHQSYAHKILTGRRKVFRDIRTRGGIAGFTSRRESSYDPFGAGHSSTSISAAAGFAEAQQNATQPRAIIAVIGDGALTGGMAFEALNYLGQRQLPVLVILNDNFSSIDFNVGALAAYNSYQSFFEALGWQYLDCPEGNSLPQLLGELELMQPLNGPTLLHIITEKGKGLIGTAPGKSKGSSYSFSTALGEIMKTLLEQNERLHIVSPAMLSGAGLRKVGETFPERVHDVGIAEQHAVTMAAGMAAAGLPVLCHLYATFAQRAFDQIIHDVALQELPVLFCLDRAGIVGADGATHHGLWDTALWGTLPNIHLWEPQDASEMATLINDYVQHPRPMVLRYPKEQTAPWTRNVDKPQPLREEKHSGQTLVVSTGSLSAALRPVCAEAKVSFLHVGLLQPFPHEEIAPLLQNYQRIIVMEEHVTGGTLLKNGVAPLLQKQTEAAPQVASYHLPAAFIEHGSRAEWLAHFGLDAAGLRRVLEKEG